jgi:predicted nicotinamide N-methyase
VESLHGGRGVPGIARAGGDLLHGGEALDPLRASLVEQLRRLRGGPLPDALLDICRESVEGLTLIRPRDWSELRHVEGGAGRGVPYWAALWPSGRTLAEELARRDLAGLRVLELGCGLGAPSVVAARCGARVLATDGAPEAVVFTAHNLAINELEGEVAQVDWTEAGAFADAGRFDLVIAADVLYRPANVEALTRLLPSLLEPDGEALIADPGRAGGRDFTAAARRLFARETSGDDVQLHRLTPVYG